MNTLVLLSLSILATYIILVCRKYGVPDSISDSYYYIGWKPIFTLVMWFVGGFLLPKTMTITPETQIIPFLAVCGIMLVGAAPRVRDYERTIHIIGASIGCIFSQLWILIYAYPLTLLTWIIPVVMFLSKLSPGKEGLVERLDSINFTFWSEIICFVNIYTNLLILW